MYVLRILLLNVSYYLILLLIHTNYFMFQVRSNDNKKISP